MTYGPLRSEVHLAPSGARLKIPSVGAPPPKNPDASPKGLTVPPAMRVFDCDEAVVVGDFVRTTADGLTLETADAQKAQIVLGVVTQKPRGNRAQVLLYGYVLGIKNVVMGQRYFLGAKGGLEPLPLKDEQTYRHPLGVGLADGVFLFRAEYPIHKRADS